MTMAEFSFTPGATFSTPGDDPIVKVLLSATAPLRPGIHVFQLVVVDDAGNESAPVRQEVRVIDQARPNAVLTVLPSETVPFGEGFTLSGEKSFDIGGSIKEYRWTMVS
jgi:hypothetical protein